MADNSKQFNDFINSKGNAFQNIYLKDGDRHVKFGTTCYLKAPFRIIRSGERIRIHIEGREAICVTNTARHLYNWCMKRLLAVWCRQWHHFNFRHLAHYSTYDSLWNFQKQNKVYEDCVWSNTHNINSQANHKQYAEKLSYSNLNRCSSLEKFLFLTNLLHNFFLFSQIIFRIPIVFSRFYLYCIEFSSILLSNFFETILILEEFLKLFVAVTPAPEKVCEILRIRFSLLSFMIRKYGVCYIYILL